MQFDFNLIANSSIRLSVMSWRIYIYVYILIEIVTVYWLIIIALVPHFDVKRVS